METKQLEYVVQIAQEGNLIKAAEKCYITQPAMSHFITKFESDLGYQLFFRERNNWTLTPVGEIFVQGARKILNEENEMFTLIDEYLNLPTRQIRIGVGADRGNTFLHQAIPIFRKKYSETKLVILERRSADLRNLLRDGDLDLILCPIMQRENSAEILFSLPEPILLAAAKGRKMNAFYQNAEDRFPTVNLEDLQNKTLILHGSSTSIRQSVNKLLKQASFTPKVGMELESTASIIRYVAADTGVAFLQNFYSRQYEGQADFYYVNPSININFCIATRTGTILPTAAKELVQILKDIILSTS